VDRAAARASHDFEERELNGAGETTGLYDCTARRTIDDLPALANVFLPCLHADERSHLIQMWPLLFSLFDSDQSIRTHFPEEAA
jgi:hypothetical protein